MPDDEVMLHALERQSRRLEVANNIIQAAHSELSIDGVLQGIVDSLVEAGGFVGAEVTIDATIESLQLRLVKSAGVLGADEVLIRRTPVFIRGFEIGTLTTQYHSEELAEEQSELLEFILPTLFMGIDHAVAFAEVMDYRRTLENKVVERTAQLAEAHQQLARSHAELQRAKAARDRFFANINHEIRTPLTLIQLSTDGIVRSGEELSVATKERLESVNASTRRLLHLVNSLLMLAAGDEGKLQIRPRPVDAVAIVKRLVDGFRPSAKQGELELVYTGPERCEATMDEGAVETIVGNFISNATKFTPHGGRITVGLDADADRVTIQVRDTGPGIDPEFIPKLFGRFERSASATAAGVRGTGIGLSLSKELVELQGGTIRVERNEEPRGTTFAVTLPRHQTVAAIATADDRYVASTLATTVDAIEERPPAPAASSAEPEATILLAEDDPALSRHISELIGSRYHVLTAPNGRVALEMAREHVPDLLVTDLEMPEMNGLELTKHFLALQGTGMSPVLIVSAHAGLGERLAGFEAGAVDYIVKPFSANELLARVRSQLAIRQLALKLHEAQKLAALGMLSAGLAHEIRNPANALVNALRPLLELLPEDERRPDSTGAVLSELAITAADQIRERCKNILDYSRSEQVTRQPEDLEVLVRRARRLLTDSLSKVEVREDLQVSHKVSCAAPLIEQVLINLLDNAAFAAGPGGWVSISAREQAGRIAIEVGDSGPGVPPQLTERIFDPFFTTKPVGQGTGLGLTVSRRIALNHGGDLRVVRHGIGTAFRLDLPAADT